MPTNWIDIRAFDARAVRYSVEIVRRVTAADLDRPTPCSDWNLAELLAHMTAQHRGFAAAAAGDGGDPTKWEVRPVGPGEASSAIAIGEYAIAADLVIDAFAQVGTPEQQFVLPEFTEGPSFPADRSMGFHFIDYVVHGWDVARALGIPFEPDPELLPAALPVALAVPGGERRLEPGAAFRPELPDPAAEPVPATTLDRILGTLGRSPRWPA
ncbi:TIGR03086 family metal-binding protein [Embleya sp. NBC_00896]|uniref:TIGR03086 family metal-binding protein n=1 Tax=Embleya sp. NBC_00896 TaxID=2975961 RepID=UPI002F90D14D|nr:TIGR03086 family metal-binding protein [Embleya sp. NBC_00896]